MTRFLLSLIALTFLSAPTFAQTPTPAPATTPATTQTTTTTTTATPPTATTAPVATPAPPAATPTPPAPVVTTTTTTAPAPVIAPAPATPTVTPPATTTSKPEAAPKAASANADESTKKVHEEMKAIASKLSPDDQKHFYLIYSNSNIIGTVKLVRGDVNNAINACDKANPSIKADMDKHFADWKAKVDPVIKESEGNLNNMIVAQTYAPAEKIKSILKTLDDLRQKTAKQVNSQPITTLDACQYLEGKLDSTQESLTEALRNTLISYGRATANAPAASTGNAKP